MTGGVILIQPQRQPEPGDVRDLVASAVDGFCEHFGISGPVDRRDLYREIATQAGQMAEEIRA